MRTKTRRSEGQARSLNHARGGGGGGHSLGSRELLKSSKKVTNIILSES